jgi:hypothetical protein
VLDAGAALDAGVAALDDEPLEAPLELVLPVSEAVFAVDVLPVSELTDLAGFADSLHALVVGP